MAEIEIYTGHFGSGKTEIVLNRAIEYANRGESVHVVDLDIVKPYFRSREIRHFLAEAGVDLVMPNEGLTDADLPVVSPNILGTLTSAKGKILFDVGGDPMGATALGAFAPLLKNRGYQMFLVLNPYRPFTKDIPSVTEMLKDIEVSSRLTVAGIVSNPNLGRETRLTTILEGNARIHEIADALNLPIVFYGVSAEYADRLAEKLDRPIQKVTNFLLLPWELEEGQVFQIDPFLRLPQTRRDFDAKS